MKLRNLTLSVFAILAVCCVPIAAGEVETVTEKIDSEGAEVLDIRCEFGAGEFVIRPKDIKDAAELKVTYTPRWVTYDIDYRKRGGTGHLFLESNLRRNRSHDDSENEWELTLATRYPMLLDLEVGACEAEFDLGGLPIRELSLEIGAASGRIDFSKPNPERLTEITIEVGASSLEIYNLGNANFEEMHFEGGAASCELDFHGDFVGEAEVELEIGLGSLDIFIPRDLAIRVEADESWFSSVDFHGLRLVEIDDGVYESRDFDDADKRIVFDVSVGMGSVDFRGKR